MDSTSRLRGTTEIKYEYIRGLIEGEGCFSFCSVPSFVKMPDGSFQRPRIPTFALNMHERDRELLIAINEKLSVKREIYYFKPYNKDGYNRGGTVRITIRDFGTLKNTIIPLFYNRLHGYKGIQFNNWLEKIGSDPLVPERYKLLYRLHKTGYFERELSPTGLFRKFVD